MRAVVEYGPVPPPSLAQRVPIQLGEGQPGQVAPHLGYGRARGIGRHWGKGRTVGLQRGAVHTTLGKVTDPDAILCRSNAGTMNEVMSLLEAGLTSR